MESLGGCCTLDIDTFRRTRDAVENAPEAGKGSFETVTEWRGGAQAETRARTFRIETDEPTPLGGKDQHVDPMELLLAALGSCLTIGWVTQARLRGIEYRKLVIKVQAPFDLRGYLALDPSVRPGFGQLRYIVDVDTDADATTLEEIRVAVERTSPMLDNILRPTPVEGIVARRGSVSA